MNINNEEFSDNIFSIKVMEVQYLAKKKFGRYLDEIEIKEVQKRIQFGLEYLEKVVLFAIEDVINKSNEN
jgi:hypothetical protein